MPGNIASVDFFLAPNQSVNFREIALEHHRSRVNSKLRVALDFLSALAVIAHEASVVVVKCALDEIV